MYKAEFIKSLVNPELDVEEFILEEKTELTRKILNANKESSSNSGDENCNSLTVGRNPHEKKKEKNQGSTHAGKCINILKCYFKILKYFKVL